MLYTLLDGRSVDDSTPEGRRARIEDEMQRDRVRRGVDRPGALQQGLPDDEADRPDLALLLDEQRKAEAHARAATPAAPAVSSPSVPRGRWGMPLRPAVGQSGNTEDVPPRPREGFRFSSDAAPPPPAKPELDPKATLAGLVGDDGSRQLIDLVKLLTDMQRRQQDDARGRQFGGVGGFNDAQRQMTLALRDPASRASAISGYSAANRRAALRAAGIDPDAPGASNVAWQGKTPEQYAADVKRSIDATEARRVAAADRLREKTARQRAARQAAQLPAVDAAVNPADPLDDLAQQLAKMQYA